VLIIALIALIAVQIFSINLVGGVWDATRPVWDLLGAAVYNVAALLSSPIQALLNFIHPQIHHSAVQNPGEAVLSKINQHKLKAQKPRGEPIVRLVVILIGLLLLYGLANLVWRVLPHIPRNARAFAFREERRQLVTPGEVMEMFLSWLRSLLTRSVDAAVQAGEHARRRVLGPTYPDDPVRRIYAQMLRRAGETGSPRAPATTPAEFGAQLGRRWPNGTADFARITTTYETRRYGGAPADNAAIEDLRASWHAVRPLMRHVEPQAEPRQQTALTAPLESRWRTWLRRLLSWE
jgi:hypothetical protein